MVAQVQVEPTQEETFNAFGKIQNGMRVKLQSIEGEMTEAQSEVQDCISKEDFRGAIRAAMDYANAVGRKRSVLEMWGILFGQRNQKTIMQDVANKMTVFRNLIQQIEITAKEKQ